MAGPTLIPQILVASKKIGTSFASYTTAKRIINDEDALPISAPWMNVGMELRIEGLLAISNVVTAVPTFTLQVNIGSIAVWISDAIACKATASAALPCEFDVKLRLDSIGKTNAAKFIGNGRYYCPAFNVPNGVWQAGTPAVGTGFGSTVDDGSAVLDVFGGWSASNASNAVQVVRYNASLFQY